MRRAAEDLNELLIGNALPTMARCSRQPPNLFPDSRMLKIRRMNADPNQWSASQSKCQATIPCQARHRPPTSASAPNKGLRSDIGTAAKGLHPAESGRIQETELADRDFGVGTKQPCRRNKADPLSRQKREILQTALHSNRGFLGG